MQNEKEIKNPIGLLINPIGEGLVCAYCDKIRLLLYSKRFSGIRDSNSWLSAWKADALASWANTANSIRISPTHRNLKLWLVSNLSIKLTTGVYIFIMIY